jgi:hypothetical protein
MLGFAVRADPATQNRFAAAPDLITPAVSPGPDETSIVRVGSAGLRVAHHPGEFRRWGHRRLPVGPEDPIDRVADLEQLLTLTLGPRPAAPRHAP